MERHELPSDLVEQLRRVWNSRMYSGGRSATFDEWLANRNIESVEDGWNLVHEYDERVRQVRLESTLDDIIPWRYDKAEADDPQIAAWADSFLANTKGSILILGPVGVGKTHQAYGLLRQLLSKSGEFDKAEATTAVELYAALRPRDGVDSEGVFERYAGAELLLVDDLGTGKISEWVEEITYRLIDRRYNNLAPTIITSNVPPKELSERLGDRTASRLTQMCSSVVLKGQDRRRAA